MTSAFGDFIGEVNLTAATSMPDTETWHVLAGGSDSGAMLRLRIKYSEERVMRIERFAPLRALLAFDETHTKNVLLLQVRYGNL